MLVKKYPVLLLALAAVLCLLLPAATAFADDGMEVYYIDKVLVQTYPGDGGNNIPYVGQEWSAFYAQTTTSGVAVTGCSLIDSSGTACTGKVENKGYTLSVSLSSQVINFIFTSDTKAYMNNEPCNISVSADGFSATISRQISPRLVAPTIWKNPGDETHNSGQTFSFAASASPTYNSVQWYVRSPYNQTVKAEEINTLFVNTTGHVVDHGSGGSTLNLSGVPVDMDGWSVYCEFKGDGGSAYTSDAFLHVSDAAAILAATPVPSPTPAITIIKHPLRKSR